MLNTCGPRLGRAGLHDKASKDKIDTQKVFKGSRGGGSCWGQGGVWPGVRGASSRGERGRGARVGIKVRVTELVEPVLVL